MGDLHQRTQFYCLESTADVAVYLSPGHEVNDPRLLPFTRVRGYCNFTHSSCEEEALHACITRNLLANLALATF